MTSPKESAGIHYSTRIFFKAKMNLYLVQQSITNLLLAKGVGEAIGLYQQVVALIPYLPGPIIINTKKFKQT